ncbi:MAG: DUF1318 domain-containing protein [Acidobacteriota bacterium]
MHTQNSWKALFLAVLGLTAIACITINVYFPEAAVRDLSEKIEDAVARKAAALDPPAETPAPGDEAASEGGRESASLLQRAGGRAIGLALAATASPAYAQQVAAPEISNPAIRKIIDSRARRIAALNAHKASGALGEGKNALVKIRALDSLPLRERAQVQKLVRDENSDRERMFREIAAATDADLSQLGRIQETYAATLRAKAVQGEWLEAADGTWSQK